MVHSGLRHVLLLAFPTPIAPVHSRQRPVLLLPSIPDSLPYYCSRSHYRLIRRGRRRRPRVHSGQRHVLLLTFPTPTYKTRTPKASEGPFRTTSRTIAHVPNTNCSFPFLIASLTIAPVHSEQRHVLLLAFPTPIAPFHSQ